LPLMIRVSKETHVDVDLTRNNREIGPFLGFVASSRFPGFANILVAANIREANAQLLDRFIVSHVTLAPSLNYIPFSPALVCRMLLVHRAQPQAAASRPNFKTERSKWNINS
jgi:hypothetical protein